MNFMNLIKFKDIVKLKINILVIFNPYIGNIDYFIDNLLLVVLHYNRFNYLILC